jgi:hypothetical protein
MTKSADYTMAEIAGYLSLWMAIHGVEPEPDGTISEKQASEIAGNIVEALSSYLVFGAAPRAVDDDTVRGLAQFGMEPLPQRRQSPQLRQRIRTERGVFSYPGGERLPARR